MLRRIQKNFELIDNNQSHKKDRPFREKRSSYNNGIPSSQYRRIWRKTKSNL
jgi:hypothetical protein